MSWGLSILKRAAAPYDARGLTPLALMKIVRLGDRYFDLHSPEDRARVSPAALRLFLDLMRQWEVDDCDARTLMGRVTVEELERMRSHPEGQVLDPSKLKRVACLVSIWRELSLLHGPHIAGEWIRLPNSHPMFCRVKPLNFMLIGGAQAMANVLRLLAQRRRVAGERAAGEAEALSSPRPSGLPD